MKPKTFNEATRMIALEIADLVIKKQMDYGKDNILAFGELGVLIRANDKIARLKNLLNKEGVTEPRIDAWVDIIGYGIIALLLDRDWFGLELEEK